MSEWKVGDLVTTPGFRHALIYKIVELELSMVKLETIWVDCDELARLFLRREIVVGHVRTTPVEHLEHPNEMKVLALVAAGDLDV